MSKKKNSGGVRPGAGRKKSDDPNIPITLQVKTSKITELGGKDGVKEVCYQALYPE